MSAGREAPGLFADGVLEAHGEREALRVLEAVLFAAAEPLDEASLAARLPAGADVPALVEALAGQYAGRGVQLVRLGECWAFRTAPDLAHALQREAVEPRRLSRAAMETLAIIAYHQPVTRAEIEEIRGVSAAKGTLDVLLETGWVRMRGRRRAPGRPIAYGTGEAFLEHFNLESLDDLPGLDELKGAGLLDASILPSGADTQGAPGEEGPDEAAEFPDEAAAEDGPPFAFGSART